MKKPVRIQRSSYAAWERQGTEFGMRRILRVVAMTMVMVVIALLSFLDFNFFN